MTGFVVLLWIVGGAGAGVLSVVVGAENPRIVRAGRIGFALLLAVDLFLAALILAIGTSNGDPAGNTTRSMWWMFVIGGGIPLAFVSGFAVRRGFVGHRLALWSAVLLTAALYLVFPFAFTPAGQELQGLGRFAHANRAIAVVILLLPSLIILGSEMLRRDEATDEPSLMELLRRAPRRYVAGFALAALVLIWFAAANALGFVLVLAVLILGGGIFVGLRSRATVRRMRRDLE